MENFFKYMSTSTALIILKDSTLKFTHPNNFNDPFDYYPSIDAIGLTKYYKKFEKQYGPKSSYKINNFKTLRARLKELRSDDFRQKISEICSISCSVNLHSYYPCGHTMAKNMKVV